MKTKGSPRFRINFNFGLPTIALTLSFLCLCSCATVAVIGSGEGIRSSADSSSRGVAVTVVFTTPQVLPSPTPEPTSTPDTFLAGVYFYDVRSDLQMLHDASGKVLLSAGDTNGIFNSTQADMDRWLGTMSRYADGLTQKDVPAGLEDTHRVVLVVVEKVKNTVAACGDFVANREECREAAANTGTAIMQAAEKLSAIKEK